MSPADRSPTRLTLPDAREDRLFFAQVREDPCIELEALDVWAFQATLSGERRGPALDDRPLHHEIALV